MLLRHSRALRLVVAVLVVAIALPLGRTALAQDQSGVDGNTYTAPTFGYTLSWDEEVWQVTDEYSEDGYDGISLASDESLLYIESFYFYQGDPVQCLEGERAALAEQGDLDDLDPMTNADGEPIESTDEGSASGLYVWPESDEFEASVVYVECRTLIPDSAVMVITAFLDPDDLESGIGTVDEVVSSINPADASDAGISDSDLEQSVTQTDQDVVGFWQTTFDGFDQDWVNPKFITYFDPTETECGDIEPGYDGPLYCPGDQTVYLDEGMIEDEMLPFGMIVVQVMLAHEIGHHVQALLNLNGCDLAACGVAGGSLAVELQADCLAGAWMRDAADRGFVRESDLKRVEVGVKSYFGDPPGTAKDDPEAHGSGEVRFALFMAGYTQGLPACAVQ
jgi:predicted metalloprotease